MASTANPLSTAVWSLSYWSLLGEDFSEVTSHCEVHSVERNCLEKLFGSVEMRDHFTTHKLALATHKEWRSRLLIQGRLVKQTVTNIMFGYAQAAWVRQFHLKFPSISNSISVLKSSKSSKTHMYVPHTAHRFWHSKLSVTIRHCQTL